MNVADQLHTEVKDTMVEKVTQIIAHMEEAVVEAEPGQPAVAAAAIIMARLDMVVTD